MLEVKPVLSRRLQLIKWRHAQTVLGASEVTH
jgi:hypothetical protein